MTTPTTADRPNSDRVEALVLVTILLLVAGFAGAASFTHVKDWTLANSPAGTGEWFGWANAVISELVPVAALLTIRRRRRNRQPVSYPLALLLASAGLSLAAQLAVAKPGPSGWLLSAVPALAFMALVKLVLAPVPAPAPAAANTDTATTVPTAGTTAPTPPTDVAPVVHTPPTVSLTPADDDSVDVPARLVSAARMVTVQHRQTSTEPITATELAARLNTSPAVAGQLLAAIDNPTPERVNGNTPALGGAR